jgi:hypothetical protein
MFGHNQPPQGPPSEAPQQAQGPMPMPALRTFKVTRTGEWDVPVEAIYINAHGLAVADDNRTVFQTWRIDPVIGPQFGVSRILTSVIDVEDVTPAPVADEPSRIIH